MEHPVTDETIRARLSGKQDIVGKFYIHYKTKNIYRVDAVALFEEDMTTVLITYHPVLKPDMHFVRTWENWNERIHVPVGSTDGYVTTRFEEAR